MQKWEGEEGLGEVVKEERPGDKTKAQYNQHLFLPHPQDQILC